MSATGLQLLTQWEGSKSHVYNDSAGLPTIGVGHLLLKSEIASGRIAIGGKPVSFKYGLTEAQVRALLAQDIVRFEDAINRNVKTPLRQNQFDALVSFCFNVGIDAFLTSTLFMEITRGNLAAVPTELRRWVTADGKRIPGLVMRRENEILLWLGKLGV